MFLGRIIFSQSLFLSRSTKKVSANCWGNLRNLEHGSYKKLKPFFKDFSRTFQGPNLFFKDPSWNVMLLV